MQNLYIPLKTASKYFISLILSYVIFPLLRFRTSLISARTVSWIDWLNANSYKAWVTVNEEVSKPAAKKTKACAAKKPSLNSANEWNYVLKKECKILQEIQFIYQLLISKLLKLHLIDQNAHSKYQNSCRYLAICSYYVT